MGAKRFTFSSAGLTVGAVEPQTIWFLAEKGADISHQASRSVEQVPDFDQTQVIVALCKEAEKVLPHKPTKTLGLHWAVPDPSKARGTPEEVRAEYERAYKTLANHIRDLVQAILGNDQDLSDENASPTI
jgi:arsenate reductase